MTTQPLYLAFTNDDDLVTIWRQVSDAKFYPTLIEFAFEETDRDDATIGVLQLDIPTAKIDDAKWYFRDRIIDLDKLNAERDAESKRHIRRLQAEERRLRAAAKFVGCGDPDYRAGGSI